MKTAFDMNSLAAALKSRMEEKEMKEASYCGKDKFSHPWPVSEEESKKQVFEFFRNNFKDSRGRQYSDDQMEIRHEDGTVSILHNVKATKVRISRIAHFIRKNTGNTLPVALTLRMFNVLQDMQELHGVKWISGYRYEVLCWKITDSDSKMTSLLMEKFYAAVREYDNLQYKIHSTKTKLDLLQMEMKNLVK